MRRIGTSSGWLGKVALAFAGSLGVAHAQERPLAEGEARARLGAFLTEGALAPCPGETKDSVLRSVVRASALDRELGGLVYSKPGELVAAVDSTSGTVVFFARYKKLLYVDERTREGKTRPAAERAAEIARRARTSTEESARRARTFLEARHPSFRERVFVVASQERIDRDSLVQDEIVFEERPRAGVVACWPNQVHVSVDPESGAVTDYLAREERIESKVAPKLDREAARRALLARLAGRLSASSRARLEATGRVELVAVRGADGAPRTTWRVERLFLVDATSGELTSSGGVGEGR